jgi:hypothetical protein
MSLSSNADLLIKLKTRFEQNKKLHEGIEWTNVEEKIRNNSRVLKILQAMESTGGEPDVIGYELKSDKLVFCDCSAESPSGRRSLCYDRQALEKRKENKPVGSATEMAEKLGVEILTEAQYRDLQKLGEFDRKTSSWISTPETIRKLGGALFCDRRYDHVFTYHNGADSYYAARGFRGMFKF